MKSIFATAVCALGVALLPAAASAESAFTSASVVLRTGPDAGYPAIVTLPVGQQVEIYGCVNDWSWCDIGTGYERGWVSAGYLDYDYRGRRVRIRTYGGEIGLRVLDFVLGPYWDEHYRGKAWYPQRDRWAQHPPARAVRPQPARRPLQQAQPNRPQPGRRPQQGQPNRPEYQAPTSRPQQGRGGRQQPRPGGGQQPDHAHGRDNGPHR